MKVSDVEAALEKQIIQKGEQLQRLRELRLWHWKENQKHRRLQEFYERKEIGRTYMKGEQPNAQKAKNYANRHIKFVQTLNDFFEAGDTAERDADNET